MLNKIAMTVVALLFCVTTTFAQTNINLGGITVDTSAAVEVSADSLSVDQDTGTAIFSGSVIIAQGDLKLSAGNVEVVYADATGEISRLVASNGVTFVTSTEAAEAQNAEYDLVAGTMTLTGDVLLTQGASAISAETMVVNITDGTATMEGRVRTVFQQGGN